MRNIFRRTRALPNRKRTNSYLREHARRSIISNYNRGLIAEHTMRRQLRAYERD